MPTVLTGDGAVGEDVPMPRPPRFDPGRWVAAGLVVALGLAACSGSSASKPAASKPAGTTRPSTTSSTKPLCPEPARAPVVKPSGSRATGTLLESASIEPGPHSVLTAVVRARASKRVTVAVTATSDPNTIDVPVSGSAATHELPVVGMRADADYDVAVTATAANGEHETLDLTFHSGTLPTDLPPISTTISRSDAMAPGITLFNAMYWGAPPDAPCAPRSPERQGWIVGVDADGEIVWYYRTLHPIADVSETKEGDLLVSVHDAVIRKIDMLGNTVSELGSRVATTLVKTDLLGHEYTTAATKSIPIDSAHHELTQLPNGNLLTISTEVIDLDRAQVAGMCDGKTDQDGKPVADPRGVVGDVVVELTPAGKVVHEWKLSDYFDPLERPGSDMCANPATVAPPNWFYPGRKGLRDWTHANAAAVDAATNTLLVSSRHLDAVIGIRYAADTSGPAGELLWVLSPTDGTLTLERGDPSYHGHAVEPESDGRILYFDNGNLRPGTTEAGGTTPMYSRAVMYRLDPVAGTATQVWQHRDDEPEGSPVYANFLGDADMEPNGNVLITYGGASTKDGLNYSRIVEVVPGGDGSGDQVVFDLTLGDRRTVGWTAYRADRVPSLYFASR